MQLFNQDSHSLAVYKKYFIAMKISGKNQISISLSKRRLSVSEIARSRLYLS